MQQKWHDMFVRLMLVIIIGMLVLLFVMLDQRLGNIEEELVEMEIDIIDIDFDVHASYQELVELHHSDDQ